MKSLRMSVVLCRSRIAYRCSDWHEEAGQAATEYALLILLFISLFILFERATTQWLLDWYAWFVSRISRPAV